MRKIGALLLVGMMTVMLFAGFSSSPAAPQINATISAGNTNPSLMYVCAADKDAVVDETNPTTNYGALNQFWLYQDFNTSTGATENRSWVYAQYNLSPIPDSVIIDKAVLRLYLETVDVDTTVPYWSFLGGWSEMFKGAPLQIRRASASWDESTIDFSTAPGNIGSPDEIVRISKHSTNDMYNITSYEFNTYIELDITPFVAGWINGSYPNNGLQIQLQTGQSSSYATTFTFESKEAFYSKNSLVVYAHSTLATCHLSYFSNFTGAGLPSWQFNVSTKIGGGGFNRTTPDLCQGIIGSSLQVRVLDFFGNSLYNRTRTILNDSEFWDIPLNVYSVKITNAQVSAYCKVWIWYSNASAPYQEYLGCGETAEYFLLPHWYLFGVTNYDNTGIVGTTVTFARFIHQASYYIVSDGLIEEILNVATGTQSRVKVVTDLLTPSLCVLAYDLPMVPAMIPWVNRSSTMPCSIVVSFTTLQIRSSTGFVWFNQTGPDPFTLTTRTVLSDTFYFTGNYSTHLMINNTATGITEYSALTLPSTVSLNGSDYTIWSNQTISVSRSLGIRFSMAFSYNFYPSGNPIGANAYVASVMIGNPDDSETTWRGIDLFIPREPSSSWDNRSLRVFDINNSVTLNEGVQYAVSSNGVYMFFSSLDNGTFRCFQVSYTNQNDSRTLSIPRVIVNTVGDGNTLTVEWNGGLFWYSDVTWRNDYREKYEGPLNFEMDVSPAMDNNGPIIILTANGAAVTTAIVSGNLITIPSVSLNPGESISYRIMWTSAVEGGSSAWAIAGVPLWTVLALIAVMTFFLAIFLKFGTGGGRKHNSEGDVLLSISVVCLLALFLLLVSDIVVLK